MDVDVTKRAMVHVTMDIAGVMLRSARLQWNCTSMMVLMLAKYTLADGGACFYSGVHFAQVLP